MLTQCYFWSPNISVQKQWFIELHTKAYRYCNSIRPSTSTMLYPYTFLYLFIGCAREASDILLRRPVLCTRRAPRQRELRRLKVSRLTRIYMGPLMQHGNPRRTHLRRLACERPKIYGGQLYILFNW